jgi:hypothetical protein
MLNIKGYFKATGSRVYSVLGAFPLFILYEAICFIAALQGSFIRNGADVLLRSLVSITGIRSFQGFFFTAALCSLIYIWPDLKKKNVPLKYSWFIFMILESFVYALFLAPLTVFFMTKTGLAFIPDITSIHQTASFFQHFPGQVGNLCYGPGADAVFLSSGAGKAGFIHEFGLMLGAGLYEELFFRLILINLGIQFFSRVFKKTRGIEASVYSVLLSSILFSAFHHIGSLGEVFVWKVFIFRFFAGLILSIIYVFRGFGIAAWSHALYDLIILFTKG